MLNRGNGVFGNSFQIDAAPAEAAGTFTPPAILAAATDANGDGHVDVVYRYLGAIWVAPGRGDGTFGRLIASPVVRDVAPPDLSAVFSLGAAKVGFALVSANTASGSPAIH